MMRGNWFRFALACLLSAALSSARAEDKPAELDLKIGKGEAALYTVKKSSSTEGGQFSSRDESQIDYRIEVEDGKAGDLTLKVTYVSVKARNERRDRTWEFDSSKKEAGDEAAQLLRDSIQKPVTVKVSGGKITEVKGFPDVQPPAEGDREGFRRFGATRIAGRRALERDLELILAMPVQKKALEKGKEYRVMREASSDEGGGRRGRGFFRMADPALSFRYDGEEKAGDLPAARFTLSAAPAPVEGDAPRGELKVEGKALVSQKDGLLLQLESKAEGKREFERDGETRTFTSQSKTSITRGKVQKVETVRL